MRIDQKNNTPSIKVEILVPFVADLERQFFNIGACLDQLFQWALKNSPPSIFAMVYLDSRFETCFHLR